MSSSVANNPCLEWLITSTSCASSAERDRLVTDILDHLRRQTENGSHWCGPSSATEMSKVIVDYCVGAYDRKRKVAIPNSNQRKRSANDTQSPKGLMQNSTHDSVQKGERSIRQIFSDSINHIVCDTMPGFTTLRLIISAEKRRGETVPYVL